DEDGTKNGNAPPITQVGEGVETTIAPATAEEKAQKDAKSLLQAVEKRFGGNAATKKTLRILLKKFSMNGNETIGFDKSKVECTTDTKENTLLGSAELQEVNISSTKRIVPIETPTSSALVSCDGLGCYDWSDQVQGKHKKDSLVYKRRS
nr:hypothetical protein [Tanacetum cinerariifolium]